LGGTVVDPIRHDVELREQNAEVRLTVLDLDVVPGDLIHADHHGAVAIRV
jgi:regulator of RNase E activity RraA